jgi:AcrR family transcriptional regulator
MLYCERTFTIHMRAAKIRTEIRQDQIAQAALRLIARHGFHHLNVAAVAKEVGVVTSAIYRHYQSKDQVLDAVLCLVSQRLLGNVGAARRETSNSLDRLHSVLMRHVELVQNDVPIPRVVFSEEIFTGHAKRRRQVHQIFQRYLAKVAGLIREGQGGGEIRKEFSPRTLSLMFLGLVQPAAILWLMSQGGFGFTRHVESAWSVFRRMIQTEAKAEGAALSTRGHRAARTDRTQTETE